MIIKNKELSDGHRLSAFETRNAEMGDPMSIASGIFSLITNVYSLYEFFSDVASADRDARDAQNDLRIQAETFGGWATFWEVSSLSKEPSRKLMTYIAQNKHKAKAIELALESIKDLLVEGDKLAHWGITLTKVGGIKQVRTGYISTL